MVKTALKAACAASLLTLCSWSQAQTTDWQTCHTSKVKALAFFTVGEASLARHNCQTRNLLTPPVRLTFRYFREVPGDAFAKAAMNFLEKNLEEDTFVSHRTRFEQFNRHYQDIGDGDAYSLTHTRDHLLILKLNGQELARESGRAFANGYFQIWFGDQPYSRRLKQNLLGR